MAKPTVYHIPVCPFSQRLEILLDLKGVRYAVDFHVVDITVPRPDWLLALSDGTTALPILRTADDRVIKESLVILTYLDQLYADTPVARPDPYEHAVENMLIRHESAFTVSGYRFVMNREPERRQAFVEEMLGHYRAFDSFLRKHSPGGPFLFEKFGLAETVFTPMFMRFWFLDYYEDFAVPEEGFERLRAWRDACLAHPAAGQVTREEIVKLYYDYALGAGNGALPEGRRRSSFVFEPHWRDRPWPPREKYGAAATDAELGLL